MRKKTSLLTAVIVAVLLASCGPKPTPVPPDVAAQVAVAVALTSTAMARPGAPTTTQATPVPSSQTETSTPIIQASNTPGPCLDQAALESASVAENSSFTPGQTFTQTWKLQNTGTCTWMPDYTLVFDGGEQMNAPSPVPFPGEVPPGGAVDLSVVMQAPAEIGDHSATWKLRSPAGTLFGTGDSGADALVVKITVAEASTDLNLGDPTWKETFDSTDKTWILGADDTLDFEIKENALQMTALKQAGDRWRLAQLGGLGDFYLQIQAKSGSTCSGKDSYGLVARSIDTAGDKNYNSAYAFGISCDGRYRLYVLNNGDYQALTEWKPSADILSGPNQTNTIGIRLKGSNIRLYANGKLLQEFNDSTLTRGLFGLFVRAVDSSTFTVSVQEVAYWTLP